MISLIALSFLFFAPTAGWLIGKALPAENAEIALRDLRLATLGTPTRADPDTVLVLVTPGSRAAANSRAPLDRAFLARLVAAVDAGARRGRSGLTSCWTGPPAPGPIRRFARRCLGRGGERGRRGERDEPNAVGEPGRCAIARKPVAPAPWPLQQKPERQARQRPVSRDQQHACARQRLGHRRDHGAMERMSGLEIEGGQILRGRSFGDVERDPDAPHQRSGLRGWQVDP